MSTPRQTGAADRLRAYLDAFPDMQLCGPEFAFGTQFRSDEWPRDCYCPTREDLEALLTELTSLRERSDTLSALERHGVDNWDGYEDAVNGVEL